MSVANLWRSRGKFECVTRGNVLCEAGRVGEGAEVIHFGRRVRVGVYGLPNGKQSVDLASCGISMSD